MRRLGQPRTTPKRDRRVAATWVVLVLAVGAAAVLATYLRHPGV